MEYIVTKSIPINELGGYDKYVNYLFLNEDGVYNICRNVEDVEMSNKWFKNFPLKTIVVSDENPKIGDKVLITCENLEMNGKIFTYVSLEDDIVKLRGEDKKEVITNINVFENAYKFIRKATMDDKERVVNGIKTPIIK